MVALSPPPANSKWSILSFVSTLYLCPVIDQLIAEVPKTWHSEVRLGLQEALVNAAKHGNRLDPGKKISVRFARTGGLVWWIIADQGGGFIHPRSRLEDPCCDCHDLIEDCGRGLYILYQIFDEVHWHEGGRELHLCKQVGSRLRQPRIQ